HAFGGGRSISIGYGNALVTTEEVAYLALCLHGRSGRGLRHCGASPVSTRAAVTPTAATTTPKINSKNFIFAPPD
ncbi:MAG: hypothetical protein Q7R39_20945, partial [Dehalococcoidia bacterium]|nr:hypothetical protein [Dehalococcoidia bacterium]